jgi:phage-related protein
MPVAFLLIDAMQHICYTDSVWTIEYYSAQVEQEILDLPSGLLARYLRLADMLQAFGANLGMPHTRAMGDGLLELRVKSKEGIARVFYCTLVGQRIVMLHTLVKKSQKTPQRELTLAYRRMQEVTQP